MLWGSNALIVHDLVGGAYPPQPPHAHRAGRACRCVRARAQTTPRTTERATSSTSTCARKQGALPPPSAPAAHSMFCTHACAQAAVRRHLRRGLAHLRGALRHQRAAVALAVRALAPPSSAVSAPALVRALLRSRVCIAAPLRLLGVPCADTIACCRARCRDRVLSLCCCNIWISPLLLRSLDDLCAHSRELDGDAVSAAPVAEADEGAAVGGYQETATTEP